MTLESGDRLLFNIAGGIMMLQAVSKENLDREDGGMEAVDTVEILGRQVVKLIKALKACGGEVVPEQLSVSCDRDATWHMRHVVLRTVDNSVRMTAEERDLVLDAIRSRAWRLFS